MWDKVKLFAHWFFDQFIYPLTGFIPPKKDDEGDGKQ